MFWSGALIERELKSPSQIVSDFHESRIDCAAYTLRMGGEVFISPTVSGGGGSVTRLGEGETFSIPPGQFAFLLSEETIDLPADVLGFINMKSSVKLRGLVNVSGFHVDPGYKGRLVFAVFNAGPQPVTIRQGDDCFLLWFSSLTNIRENNIENEVDFNLHIRRKPGFYFIRSETVSNLGNNYISLYNLNAKVEELSAKADRWIMFLGLAGSIITALGIAWAVSALGLD